MSLKALLHPEAEYWDKGKVSDVRYAEEGEMSSEVIEESSEVHWWRESLSEQDLEAVGGASGREGLVRTTPRREK